MASYRKYNGLILAFVMLVFSGSQNLWAADTSICSDDLIGDQTLDSHFHTLQKEEARFKIEGLPPGHTIATTEQGPLDYLRRLLHTAKKLKQWDFADDESIPMEVYDTLAAIDKNDFLKGSSLNRTFRRLFHRMKIREVGLSVEESKVVAEIKLILTKQRREFRKLAQNPVVWEITGHKYKVTGSLQEFNFDSHSTPIRDDQNIESGGFEKAPQALEDHGISFENHLVGKNIRIQMRKADSTWVWVEGVIAGSLDKRWKTLILIESRTGDHIVLPRGTVLQFGYQEVVQWGPRFNLLAFGMKFQGNARGTKFISLSKNSADIHLTKTHEKQPLQARAYLIEFPTGMSTVIIGNNRIESMASTNQGMALGVLTPHGVVYFLEHWLKAYTLNAP